VHLELREWLEIGFDVPTKRNEAFQIANYVRMPGAQKPKLQVLLPKARGVS
jgi:hypothetical protein